MAINLDNIQNPEDEEKDPKVEVTPPVEVEQSEVEQVEAQEPVNTPQEPGGTDDTPTDGGGEDDPLTEEQMEEVQGEPVEGYIGASVEDEPQETPPERERDWGDKLASGAMATLDFTSKVFTNIPEGLMRGTLTAAESGTELVSNVAMDVVVKPMVEVLDSVGVMEGDAILAQKRVDFDFTEWLGENEFAEAEGNLFAFIGLMFMPIPGARAAGGAIASTRLGLGTTKMFAKHAPKMKTFLNTNVVGKTLSKTEQMYFRLSGGHAIQAQAMKGAFLMPADFDTLITDKDEDVNEIYGRLQNMLDEGVLAPMFGGAIKTLGAGSGFIKKNVLFPLAVRINAEKALRKGLNKATTQAERDAVADQVIKILDDGGEEFVNKAVANHEAELAAVQQRRTDFNVADEASEARLTGAVDDKLSQTYSLKTLSGDYDPDEALSILENSMKDLEGQLDVFEGTAKGVEIEKRIQDVDDDITEWYRIDGERYADKLEGSPETVLDDFRKLQDDIDSGRSDIPTWRAAEIEKNFDDFIDDIDVAELTKGGPREFKSSDGYSFFLKSDGTVVDSLDKDKVGFLFSPFKSLKEFLKDTDIHASFAKKVDDVVEEIPTPAQVKADTQAGKEALESAKSSAEEAGGEVEGRWLDLGTIFKSKSATKELARIAGIKVTQQGSRKHRPMAELQEEVAAHFKMELPPGTGRKPSEVPFNVSRKSQDRRTQEAWKAINEDPELVEALKITPKSLEEARIEAEAILKAGGYVEDMGALGTLEKTVQQTLYPALLNYRVFDMAIAKRVEKLTKMFDAASSGLDQIELSAAYVREMDDLAKMYPTLKQAQGDIARELGFMRNISDSTPITKVLDDVASTPEKFEAYLKEMYPELPVEEANRKFLKARERIMQMARHNPQIMDDVLTLGSGYGPLAMKVLLGQYVNSMLSGITTAIINTTAPVPMTFATTLERAVGELSEGNVKKAWTHVKGIMATLEDVQHAVKIAGKAAKANDSILDKGRASVDDFHSTNNSIVEDVMGRPPKNGEQLIDYYNNFVTAPSRGLIASDEYWKNLIYRKELRTELLFKAQKEAATLRAAGEVADEKLIFKDLWETATQTDLAFTRNNLADVATKRAKDAGYEEGTAQYSEFHAKYMLDNWDASIASAAETSLKRAREVTFTSDLQDEVRSTLVQGVGHFFEDNPIATHWFLGPLLKSRVPFVRVPMNLIAWWGDRQVVAPLRGVRDAGVNLRQSWKKMRSVVDSDFNYTPRTAEEAAKQKANIGKLTTGAGLTYWAYTKTLTGSLTGGGPEDPTERRELEATGWRPYSLKRTRGDGTTEWVSYLRLDPFAMFLGAVADAGEGIRAKHGYDDLSQATIDDWIVMGAMSAYKQLDDRTFLRGLQETMTIVEGKDDVAIEIALTKTMGNLLPYGNFLNSLKQAYGDEISREIPGHQSILNQTIDAMRLKIPGVSKSMPPRLDNFGQPISAVKSWQGPDALSPYFPPETINAAILPLRASADKKDYVADELARMMKPFWSEEHGSPISRPQKVLSIAGIPIPLEKFKWTTKEGNEWNLWHKYQLYAGQILNDEGRNMKQQVEYLMKTDGYADAPEYDPNLKIPSKMTFVTETVNAHRQMALNRIAMEAIKSEVPEEKALGMYITLYTGALESHIGNDEGKKKLFMNSIEDLLGREEGSYLAAEALLKAGIR